MRIYKKIYKARFVHGSAYSDLFKYSNCVIPVSVGQSYHDEQKFLAMLDLVNQNFSSCTIIVADLLQRHTFSLEISNDLAYYMALDAGKSWVKSQLNNIGMLTIPYSIRYWNEWLSSDQYKTQREITEDQYQSQPEVRKAFDLSVRIFEERYRRNDRLDQLNEKAVRATILEYIKEECSVMPLWINENFHFEIYPAKRTPAMAAIYDYIIKPAYPNLLRWLQVELRSKLISVEEPEPITP